MNPQSLGMQNAGEQSAGLGMPPISNSAQINSFSNTSGALKIPEMDNIHSNTDSITGMPGKGVLSQGNESNSQNPTNITPALPASPMQPAETNKEQLPKSPPLTKPINLELTQANHAIWNFIYGVCAALIFFSLLMLYLKSWQANNTGQAQAKYQSEVESQLQSTAFQRKENTVLDIGKQAAALQMSLAGRIKFSSFLIELEKNTYKQVRFTRLAADKDGLVTVEGIANNFDDVAKAVSALQASNNFQDVKLATADKLSNGNVVFTINIKLNNSLIGG